MRTYYTIYYKQKVIERLTSKKVFRISWQEFCDVDTLAEAQEVVKDDAEYKIVLYTEELIEIKET
jgi:hypothetical protein